MDCCLTGSLLFANKLIDWLNSSDLYCLKYSLIYFCASKWCQKSSWVISKCTLLHLYFTVVVTHFRCGGIFNDYFIADFHKSFCESILKIDQYLWSYDKNTVVYFSDSPCVILMWLATYLVCYCSSCRVQKRQQESPAVADKPARRLRKVCTVYVRAVGL